MQAYFDSRWSDCPSGVVRAVRSPWSQEIIDTVPVCDDSTVELALDRLRCGAASLAEVSAEDLGKIFTKTAAQMREASEGLATLISLEQGKPLQEARQEVGAALLLLDAFAKDAYRLGRQFLALAPEARVGDRFGFTRRRPLGAVALLTPNTFPLLIPVKLVIPALAAGNATVINPASQTPFSALQLVEMLLEAGLPENAIACLTGPGEQTGQAICRHPAVDHITCYGGMASIQAIRAAIGLIPLRFNHGGMGVCLVAADADLERAVDRIVEQGFENAGQTAISAGAVYADAAVHDEVVDRLRAAIGALPVGDPAAPGTRIGPLTEAFRAVRASRLVGDLTASGASLLLGSGLNEGNLLAPALLSGIEPTSQRFFPRTGSRELLSPVMGVIRVEGSLEQAASWLDRRTQIAVSVFSEDLDRASRIGGALPVFNVHVNGIPTWRDGLLFNSQGSSRLGRRKSETRVNDLSTYQDLVVHR